MTSSVSNKSVDEKIDEHLARWRRLMTSATPTNREMAEQGVNDFYMLAEGKKPKAIIWLDSPYQAAYIPLFVTNLIEGKEWQDVMVQLKAAGPVGSPLWEERWLHCWRQILSTPVNDMVVEFTMHPGLRQPKDSVKAALLYRLERIMHDLAAEQKLQAGSMHTAESRKKALRTGRKYLPTPLGLELAKRIVLLHSKIEIAVGLNLSINIYSVLAPFLGVWDARLLAKLVPGTENYLGLKKPDPAIAEQVKKIKEKYQALDTIGANFFLWLLGPMALPNHDPPLDIDPQANGFESVASAFYQTFERSRNKPKAPCAYTSPFTLWLPYGAPWLAFALAWRYIDANLLAEVEPELECLAYMAHGAMGYQLCENVCFVCAKPLKLLINEWDRPHNSDGSAARWQDGYEVFAWRGVTIDSAFIEDKDSITSKAISTENNVELRRVMLEIYGEGRYLADVGAKKIHEDECGILYSMEFKGDETLLMVKVRNSTPEPDGSYKDYYLRVPPDMVRAKQAVAWTFGLEEKDYKPNKQS